MSSIEMDSSTRIVGNAVSIGVGSAVVASGKSRARFSEVISRELSVVGLTGFDATNGLGAALATGFFVATGAGIFSTTAFGRAAVLTSFGTTGFAGTGSSC